MALLVYYGVPGSYKTTMAVYEWLIPAWKKGRKIYTNIRGMEEGEERLKAIFPNTNASVVFLSEEDFSYKGRTFFHYMERDSLLILDEAQLSFPSHFRAKDFDQYIYSGDESWRPTGVLEAFQKHRHFGWDIIFTVQSLKQISAQVGVIAEGCWKHRNQALIGFRKQVLRIFHEYDTPRMHIRRQIQRIDKKISFAWSIYKSVEDESVVKDTSVGQSIFGDWRVRLILLAFSFSVSMLVWNVIEMGGRNEVFDNGGEILDGEDSKDNINVTSSDRSEFVAPISAQNNPVVKYEILEKENIEEPLLEKEEKKPVFQEKKKEEKKEEKGIFLQFSGYEFYIFSKGYLKISGKYYFRLIALNFENFSFFYLDSDSLINFGLEFEFLNGCLLRIKKDKYEKYVFCLSAKRENAFFDNSENLF